MKNEGISLVNVEDVHSWRLSLGHDAALVYPSTDWEEEKKEKEVTLGFIGKNLLVLFLSSPPSICLRNKWILRVLRIAGFHLTWLSLHFSAGYTLRSSETIWAIIQPLCTLKAPSVLHWFMSLEASDWRVPNSSAVRSKGLLDQNGPSYSFLLPL